MAKRTFHFPSFSIVEGDVRVDVNLDRFSSQYKKAQFWLDSQVMTDMIPFMPFLNGDFVKVTRMQSAALAGSGKVVAGAAPQGRFLYGGLVMVDPVTGSPWARKGAKKVLTDRPLKYSNPKATAKWFEPTKEMHGKEWVKGVKEIAGGGQK